MTKTERKIMDRLESGRAFSTDDSGVRERNAVHKLIAKGLAKVTARHSGCVYSRHGNGRTAYSRPNYYTSVTVRLAD